MVMVGIQRKLSQNKIVIYNRMNISIIENKEDAYGITVKK